MGELIITLKMRTADPAEPAEQAEQGCDNPTTRFILEAMLSSFLLEEMEVSELQAEAK